MDTINWAKWIPDLQVAVTYVTYVAICFFLHKIVPAISYKGEPLPPNYDSRLNYRINGLRVLIIFCSSLIFLWATGCINPHYIINHMLAFFVMGNIWAFSWIVIHYLMGLRDPSNHKHGNVLLDLWYGIELNPRILGVDMKEFAYTPTMMQWLVINLCALAVHYEKYDTVHAGMFLYQAFTFVYIVDYFYFEHAILSIYDIIEERFGFMLIWGDYVWIGFVFPLNAYIFLVDDTRVLATWQIAALVALFVTGFVIFRGTNLQKATIKANRAALVWGRPAEYVDGKLLVSGWWGICRKINYTGDLLIAYSFALTCGFATWKTWVYPAYLTTLLLHRCLRDERRCSKKYGETWAKYCARVPYRMIPGIF